MKVVESTSTASLIEAFRCYSATRSCPYKVFSDRGTNLYSREKVLRKVFRDLDWSQVQNFEISKGFGWHFTTEARSASFNGSVRIVVKLFKKARNQAFQFDRKLTRPSKLSLISSRPFPMRRPKFAMIGLYLSSPTRRTTFLCVTK